jgi:hypothetical protein
VHRRGKATHPYINTRRYSCLNDLTNRAAFGVAHRKLIELELCGAKQDERYFELRKQLKSLPPRSGMDFVSRRN